MISIVMGYRHWKTDFNRYGLCQINRFHRYIDVPVKTPSYTLKRSGQQRAFPVLFHSGTLRADRLWLKEDRDFDNDFS